LSAPAASGTRPAWLLGGVPLALIAIAIGLFAVLGAPGLGDRRGPPAEELTVERTILKPGLIELTVRNDGPDATRIAQVIVNDSFVPFRGAAGAIGRLGSERISIDHPWNEGEAYDITLVTSTGATITHAIPIAVASPDNDVGFFGLMALLGLYVGIIPVALGMLWLPWIRRVGKGVVRVVMALTVGLLGFLAIEATLEGLDLAARGPKVFGGAALVFLGAAVAYLALSAVGAWMDERKSGAPDGARLALLVAVGIGLHNMGEGVAIGSSYATGALALGAFLVIGFAIHNTTEGLAIVAPAADSPLSLGRLALLGVIAGGPAIVGAWIGASAFNASLAAFLFGIGAGAIVQVMVQIAPALRDRAGRLLHPASVGGLVAGVAIMYVTGLLVSV
jgi:zinc transporter ZupT